MHCSLGTELDVRSLIIVREKGVYTGICNISLSSLSHKSLTSLGLMGKRRMRANCSIHTHSPKIWWMWQLTARRQRHFVPIRFADEIAGSKQALDVRVCEGCNCRQVKRDGSLTAYRLGRKPMAVTFCEQKRRV